MTDKRHVHWTLVSQPKKWLWGLLPLAALGLGAWAFSSPSLESNLANAVGEKLKSSEANWASVAMDGRDAILKGTAPEEEAISAAAKMVTGTYGVRRVDVTGITVAPPVVLGLPTVNKVVGKSARPEISGTWPEGTATTLDVTIADKTYQLGKDAALTSDGSGNWMLTPPAALADGEYDVAVAVTDGKKAAAADNSKAEVLVDTTPPGAPTVAGSTGDFMQPVISGNFDKAAASLAVTTAGKTYVLGKDDELSSDGAGKWSLALPSKPEPGNYDVWVMSKDQFGNTSSVRGSDALMVAAPAAPAAPRIAKAARRTGSSKITGTWTEGEGETLSVGVGGKAYDLSQDGALTSDGKGNWSLQPDGDLPDGTHEVVAITIDVAGNIARDDSRDEIFIDSSAPDAPTIVPQVTSERQPRLSGSWPSKDASRLSVAVGSSTYISGDSDALKVDGDTWTLSLPEKLEDGTYDVRAMTMDRLGNTSTDASEGELVVDATPPAAPSIAKITGRTGNAKITGNWSESDGETLSVGVGGKAYDLSQDGALTSDGKGTWSLQPDGSLPDGTHEVVAVTIDTAGNIARDNSRDEVFIDATPPAVPGVNTYKSAFASPLLTGTFPEGDADQLTVQFGDEAFTMGSPTGPISDGNGNWAVNTQKEYAPGVYDVKVVVTDAVGNQSTDASVDEIEVLAPPRPKVAKAESEPEPAPAPKVAVNCRQLFDELLAKDAILFKTGTAVIADESSDLIGKLVSVTKQCPSAKIEIAGHTNSRGSASYNQKLSEHRAVAVREALVAKGAPATNITAVGYGEVKPIANNKTRKGRAMNRRTVFTVQP